MRSSLVLPGFKSVSLVRGFPPDHLMPTNAVLCHVFEE
jgi:hypothetical protein